MARKKISEYKAKQLIYPLLGISSNYSNDISSCISDKTYVLKVDQGVKGRMKKGLIKIASGENIEKELLTLKKVGYMQFFIEEYYPHDKSEEKFLSFERTREGIKLMYSTHGGIDIEKNKHTLKEFLIHDTKNIPSINEIPLDILKKLIQGFNDYYFSFLEINPLIINDEIYCLDMAVEVDSAGEYFVKGAWNQTDFIDYQDSTTPEELAIKKLSKESQASFSFEILNPNGSFFLLLSGGGASVVLADELYNQGRAEELANYGEYSGNPSREETKIYTENILSFMIKSTAKTKRLIIGGGIANFTDVRITFSGIVDALKNYKEKLKKQHISIYVRRGGPYEKEGYALLRTFMKDENINGVILPSQEEILTEVIHKAL